LPLFISSFNYRANRLTVFLNPDLDPLGIGFHQVGGFFGNNGEWYAECGKVESGLAEEGREGVGFRCCK